MKNNFNMGKLFPTVSITAVSLLLISCASQPTTSQTETQFEDKSGIKFLNHVYGTVLAADGSSIVEGATVYLPKYEKLEDGAITEHSLTSSYKGKLGCEKPNRPYSSFTCTDSSGNFRLPLVNLDALPIEITIEYEDQTAQTKLSINDIESHIGVVTLTQDLDTASGNNNKGKVAIVIDVSDPYEKMQNSGRSNEQDLKMFQVEYADDVAQLYDIDEEQYDIEFLSFEALFQDKDKDDFLDIFNYNMIYLISRDSGELVSMDKQNKLTLLEYISKGGELFVTTLEVEVEEPSIEGYI